MRTAEITSYQIKSCKLCIAVDGEKAARSNDRNFSKFFFSRVISAALSSLDVAVSVTFSDATRVVAAVLHFIDE